MALNAPGYPLLFLDLDGTLVGKEDIVSPRTLSALTAAQERGCTIVICTARDRYSVQKVAAQWSGHGLAILSNGAIIAEWDTGHVLQKIALSSTLVQQATRIAHDFTLSPLCFGVHAETDGGERAYTDSLFPQHETYWARNSYRITTLVDMKTSTTLEPVSMGAYTSRENALQLADAWRSELGSQVAVFASPDPKYDCWCAYLNLGAVDKAHAVKQVSGMLEVPQEKTMAIGDHVNDLAMLRWAGFGVCMGDGPEEAKACADYITGSLSEDGVAQAIERFVLR